MSWAKHAIEALGRGETVTIRPRGNSMIPRVHSGDCVTIAPCEPDDVQIDNIVLVRVSGRDYLHLVKAIDGDRYQIGNNRGHINGWVTFRSIYGKAIRVESPEAARRRQNL